MASIRKRGKHWQARVIRKGYPDQVKSFHSKSEAEVWSRQIENEIDRRVFVSRAESERRSLFEILERYKHEVTPSKRGRNYEVIRISALQREPISQLKMVSLTSRELASFRDQRLKQVSGSTVNRELNILGSVINHARREWEINIDNPLSLVKRPSSNPPRNRRLVEDEEVRLLMACTVEERSVDGYWKGARNSWLKPIVRLALATGMRRGELLSLRWEQVNMDRRVIHLPITKNGESRGIPLSLDAVSVLQVLPRAIDGRVFPISEQSLRLSFERACKRARINNLHFHDLRHEAISRLFERGLSLPEVALISGHKTWAMLRRYTHLTIDSLVAKIG